MKDATITISKSKYANSVNNGSEFISVSFWGLNEGCSSPCDSEKEADEQIEYLLKKYSNEYKIKIIDERVKQQVLQI